MRKLILFIAFLGLVITGKSQSGFPNTISIGGNTNTLSTIKGGFKALVGSVTTRYADTTAANLTSLANTPGAEIMTGDSSRWFRNFTADGWVNYRGGGSGLTSVGLIMPSGFSVGNSPLTADGDILVEGAGDDTQYIDGFGQLQTFPAIPAQFNPIAGTNVTLSGTYPNITFNANFSAAAAWLTLGNSGTTAGTNFIGTIDDVDFVGKMHNVQSFLIDSALQNASFGFRALLPATTGIKNSAFGYYALRSNTTGVQNTAIGDGALQLNDVGNSNVAVGYNALFQNTASLNTAVGRGALDSNISGYNNTAVGGLALYKNTTGFENTAVGVNALALVTGSVENTAIGVSALGFHLTGGDNTAVGAYALLGGNAIGVGTGTGNTAVGRDALRLNVADYNISLGYAAGHGNTRGDRNIYIGKSAGYDSVFSKTGSDNILIGDSVWYAAISSNSVGLGTHAIITGSNGMFLADALHYLHAKGLTRGDGAGAVLTDSTGNGDWVARPSGSGTGTVTSVATNDASGITGGTITGTGTLAIDTTIIATKFYANSVGGDGGNTIYTGNGRTGGNRTVSVSNGNLTFDSAHIVISGSDNGNIPLTINGVTGQVANVLDVNTGNGNTMSFLANGDFALPNASISQNGAITLPNASISQTGLLTLPNAAIEANGKVTLPNAVFEVNGSGYLATGNIGWDVAGNLTTNGIDNYGSDVSGSFTGLSKINKDYADANYASIGSGVSQGALDDTAAAIRASLCNIPDTTTLFATHWYVDSSVAAGGGGVTSVSGTTNRITSTGGTTPVIDISSSYVGQSSITTLGTITTGTLGAGSKILVGSDATGDIYYNGGSGAITRLAIGGANTVLHGGTTPSYSAIVNADITSMAWSKLTSTPTTLSGYGITDAASTTLTSAHILVGNGSNVATDVALSGSLSITNAGVGTLVSDANSNTKGGTTALNALTTGINNTAFGANALSLVVGTVGSTAFGANALKNNTATWSTAFGDSALFANTSGAGNVGVGYRAGALLTTTGQNTAVGFEAFYSSAGAIGNTGLGYQVGRTATGNYNTAIGNQALLANTTGIQNVGLGNTAGYSNSTASNQIFINSIFRTNYSGDQNGSPIYIQQNATVASQILTFNGKVAINSIAPTAYLHLPAGTASANTSPLKLTAGTNLTTAETGAVEYDGTDFFITNSVPTRFYVSKVLKGSGTLDFGSTVAGASTDLTITVTGATDGDPVMVGTPNDSTLSNGIFTAWVSATNTVTVRFTNTNLVTTLDPASGTFKVTVSH